MYIIRIPGLCSQGIGIGFSIGEEASAMQWQGRGSISIKEDSIAATT